MRFLPLTRQVELEKSNPEKLIEASPGSFFYRVGNDTFYIIRDSVRERIEVRKKGFATKYYNQIWYPTIQDSSIIFEQEYELWQKTGAGYNTSGWKFISNEPLGAVSSGVISPQPTPTPTPTPTSGPVGTPTPTPTSTSTPTPTPTPIGANGLMRSIYSGYFADDVNWFSTATLINSAIDTGSIQIGYTGDLFSAEWVGYFRAETTENYTFYIDSDDSSFLWIGGSAISGYTTSSALVANPEIHSPRERSGSISLVEGNVYPIRIQYGEHFGGETFTCSFSTNTISKTSDMTNRTFYIPFPSPTATPTPTPVGP